MNPQPIPDIAGVVEGWRAWMLPLNDTSTMRSVTRANYRWPPRRAAVARCDHGYADDFRPRSHVAPAEWCGCGLYSAKDYEHLAELGYTRRADSDWRIPILGPVANWGTVIEHEMGWRARYAYPVRLYVPRVYRHLMGPLADHYGVPVESWDALPFAPPSRPNGDARLTAAALANLQASLPAAGSAAAFAADAISRLTARIQGARKSWR